MLEWFPTDVEHGLHLKLKKTRLMDQRVFFYLMNNFLIGFNRNMEPKFPLVNNKELQ